MERACDPLLCLPNIGKCLTGAPLGLAFGVVLDSGFSASRRFKPPIERLQVGHLQYANSPRPPCGDRDHHCTGWNVLQGHRIGKINKYHRYVLGGVNKYRRYVLGVILAAVAEFKCEESQVRRTEGVSKGVLL